MDRRYGWSSYKSLIGKFVELSDKKNTIDGIKEFLGEKHNVARN